MLWGLESPTTRGPKTRWTHGEVAAAAVALADETGLDALSLAKVAERLGMTTTALYRYVDSKAELIELMVNAAIGDPPAIEGEGWQERCRFWVRQLARRYSEHPWLTDVKPRGMPRQPGPYAWIDALVSAISDAGVDGVRLALLLDSLIRVYAALSRADGDVTEPWLGQAITERFPALRSAASGDPSDAAAELDFAVDVVLRGAG